MYLVQVFLPLRDNRGRKIAPRHFERLASELGRRFGGLTTYARAPAIGLWKKRNEAPRRDEIIIYEVMAPRLERRWWKQQRTRLEKLFRQQEILVRGHRITRI
jgi:hypothetical protein